MHTYEKILQDIGEMSVSLWSKSPKGIFQSKIAIEFAKKIFGYQADVISENASLKALLKELEWRGPRGMNCCNFCEGWKETGHTPNCKLSKAIKD